MVIDESIDTAKADLGASSSCAKEPTSECGKYAIPNQLLATGQPSTKVFQYGGGGLGKEKELKHLPWNVRGAAKEIHSVPGLKNTS